MPYSQALPNLDQTLFNLLLALLRAPREYPELILSQPTDAAQNEPSSDSVRITHHYVAALLAVGYEIDDEELRYAWEWFTRLRFPREQVETIDVTEMNRLEGILALYPHNIGFTRPDMAEHVNSRIEKLLLQQQNRSEHFLIGDDLTFNTLWALKVLAMAHQRHLLDPNLMSEAELKSRIDKITKVPFRDKDLALALRLRYDLHNRNLNGAQKKALNTLIQVARNSRGVWDVRDNLQWLVNHMNDGQLVVGDVAKNREAFRDMILSTCYVVENLNELMLQYPQGVGVLQHAMQLWWSVFNGENAAQKLQTLFPKPYDYLFILCRTIVSLSVYIKPHTEKPLRDQPVSHIYRTMALEAGNSVESREKQSIRNALRSWIPLDTVGELQKLRLGVSGANVARITPRLGNPLNMREEIPFVRSLIVKYGLADEINLERAHYAQLPQAIQDCFVSIPQPSYIDPDDGRAYVIMSDLWDYHTLYEKIPSLMAYPTLADELGPFLIRMHRGGGQITNSDQQMLLWQMYLLPMQENVSITFNFLRENAPSDALQKSAYELLTKLNDLLGGLVRKQLDFSEFPTAYMHGDLHTRNIMLRDLSTREQSEFGRSLDFKLIDLEKFDSTGDAALDIGELLVDIEIALNKLSQHDPNRRLLHTLSERLALSYLDFAAERGDTLFATRVQLGKARALLRISKARTKIVKQQLNNSRRAPAIEASNAIIKYSQQAVRHLARVFRGLDGEEISLLD
jgi:hypothetical protein